MNISDRFNHEHFTRLWNAGKRKEAEDYRLGFIKKDEPIMVVHQEFTGPVKEDLEDLRKQYVEKTGKQLSVRYKNDVEWIKSKL